ncbi:MAG: diphthine synthase [Candidatus Thermoplasmatota archaeon]|nr:diphthine synthase [Candidatus Thermoplasmatota archaeon]
METGSLVFIGLGLYDEQDISLKGFEILKLCDTVFAEFYTAKLSGTTITKLEHNMGKSIHVLSRTETEKGDVILNTATNNKVALLVCGDPMTATTHVDLRLRAEQQGIPTRVIHGSSIATAVPGLLGLQNYKFGRTTTIAYPEKQYFPTSPYHVIADNKNMGLHTLILLDIQTEKEQYMTANEGMKLLLEMEEKERKNIITPDTAICVVGRAGSSKPVLAADRITALVGNEFGPPLHTLVVPGKLHFLEIEALMTLANLPKKMGKKLQKL